MLFSITINHLTLLYLCAIFVPKKHGRNQNYKQNSPVKSKRNPTQPAIRRANISLFFTVYVSGDCTLCRIAILSARH